MTKCYRSDQKLVDFTNRNRATSLTFNLTEDTRPSGLYQNSLVKARLYLFCENTRNSIFRMALSRQPIKGHGQYCKWLINSLSTRSLAPKSQKSSWRNSKCWAVVSMYGESSTHSSQQDCVCAHGAEMLPPTDSFLLKDAVLCVCITRTCLVFV